MTPAPSGPADGELTDRGEFPAAGYSTGDDADSASAGPDAAAQAFAEEAMSHIDSLYGGALRLTRHQQDAEDLVQDTFAKAFRARQSFKPGTNMRAWLYRIMHNAFISTYRAKQRRPQEAYGDGVEDWQLHEAESHSSSGLRSAETEALEALPDGDIQDALNALREDYREAVYLADVEGFSYKEIAEIMDCPIGTVMSRLHRGRAELRRQLADYARDRGYLRDVE